MKNKNLLIIIIFSTLISVINMMYWDKYGINSYPYSEVKLIQNERVYYKQYIEKNDNDNPKETKVSTKNNAKEIKVIKKQDEKIISNKEYLKKNDTSEKKIVTKTNLQEKDDTLEKNYSKSNVQSVFKVSTGEIKEKLTTSDKLKLAYASMELSRENYKKVEKYIYAEDAEDGLLKALELLKDNLTSKEYEKIRKIAEKFIDMDAAEMLD